MAAARTRWLIAVVALILVLPWLLTGRSGADQPGWRYADFAAPSTAGDA
jgi:hypothetical protein